MSPTTGFVSLALSGRINSRSSVDDMCVSKPRSCIQVLVPSRFPDHRSLSEEQPGQPCVALYDTAMATSQSLVL